jgi:translation initiation factor IF-1
MGEAEQGEIVDRLAGELYKVRLKDGNEIIAHVARELRDSIVRVKPGDRVMVAREDRDPARGRISGVYK